MILYLFVQTILWTVIFLWFYGPDDPAERFAITRRQSRIALALIGAQGLISVSLLLIKGLT